MEAGDGLGFRGSRVGVLGVGVVVRELGVDSSPEGRGLLLQGVSRRALLVQGVGGGADAFLGVSGRFEDGGRLLELLAALGVG